MKVPVFRSLDRSNKLFGLKGSYVMYAAFGLGGVLVMALLIGTLTGSRILGILVFAVLAVFVYMFVIDFQGKHSEKERDQMISTISLPDNIIVPPVKTKELFKVDFENKKAVRK